MGKRQRSCRAKAPNTRGIREMHTNLHIANRANCLKRYSYGVQTLELFSRVFGAQQDDILFLIRLL